jgi:predicted Ser/Thr protein kinase
MTSDPGSAAGRLPERFGAYRVESLIGAGGMGIVYRAVDEALQRPVAVKTLLPALAADPEFVARFKREAQSAAALNHPNITQIYAIGQEGAVPFFAMELIHGRSLEALLKETGPLDPATATAHILQAARGLRHAARKSLIHRDIKPSNLMLTSDGVVKITDFGLAKTARSSSGLTATGEVLGSPGYISPEQAQGADLDARSDIYSLGASLYQLVTGRLPFDAPTAVAMIVKHLNEPLRSPRLVNPAVPYPLAAAIQKMMAKRPQERFQDYDTLIRELERMTVPIRTGVASAAARPDGAPDAGDRTRPRQAAPPPGPSRTGRGIAWIPVFLAAAIGAMVVAGVVQHRRASAGARGAGGSAGEARFGSPAPATPEAAPRAPAPGGPARGGLGPLADRDRAALHQRLRDGARGRRRANLVFTANDHVILPDGRLKVFGQVTNSGSAPAAQARVRIRILDDGGSVVAEGETPLFPPRLAPGDTGRYDLPVDYRGPIGSLNAEITWIE